ncbi:MAG: sigma-70 family RNA polymerase sigma factor [Planctomycetota bacterium]
MAIGEPDLDLLLAQTGWLRSLARRLVGDPADADDLTQDTLAMALEAPPRGGADPRVLRAWLATVLRRRASHGVRAAGRRADRERVAAREDLNTDDAARIVERADTARSLAEEVLRLPDPHRSVLLLRYFEGRSTEEIAEELGLTTANVRMRLSRAMARLRASLDDRHQGDRDRWMASLAPLAGIDSNELARGAAVAPSVAGLALAMKLTLLATAVALAALAWTAWPTATDSTEVADLAPVLEPAPPVVPPTGPGVLLAPALASERAPVSATPEPARTDAASVGPTLDADGFFRPTVSGIVRDREGAAVPGARIEADWGLKLEFIDFGLERQPPAWTTSDERGRYTLTLPKRRLMRAVPPRHRGAPTGETMYYELRVLREGFEPFALLNVYPTEAPDSVESDLELARASSVKTGVTIRVQAPLDLDASGAKVELVAAPVPSNGERVTPLAVMASGADGRALFSEVPEVPFVAIATLEIGLVGQSEIVDPSEDPLVEVPIRVADQGWIGGVVRDAAGTPMRNGHLDVLLEAPLARPNDAEETEEEIKVGRVRARSGGRFAIGDLEERDYWLRLPGDHVVGPIRPRAWIDEICPDVHLVTLRVLDEHHRAFGNPIGFASGPSNRILDMNPNELGEQVVQFPSGTWTLHVHAGRVERRKWKWNGTSETFTLPGHGTAPIEIVLRSDS